MHCYASLRRCVLFTATAVFYSIAFAVLAATAAFKYFVTALAVFDFVTVTAVLRYGGVFSASLRRCVIYCKRRYGGVPLWRCFLCIATAVCHTLSDVTATRE